MIIGFVGLIGAGKDTAADYLVNVHNFRRDSFANTLKDAVAAIFGWDRTLLEGRTAESRAWREQIDPWWAQRLNMPDLTPRWILQHWGTEVARKKFHDDIWIASLENKLRKTTDNIVISDVRFPNEIAAIHNAGGIVVQVDRGELPDWYADAMIMNAGPQENIVSNLQYQTSCNRIKKLGIHSSETSWIGGDIDYVVINDGDFQSLYNQIAQLVKNQGLNLLVAKAI